MSATSGFRQPHLTHIGGDPEALWASYWTEGSVESRNAVVVFYGSLVASAVDRLPRSIHAYWEVEDLRSYGLLGLMDAITRFSPGSTVSSFPRFATKRIRGAVYDELRRLDWLPRRVRREVRSYAESEERLVGALGRMPHRAEVLSDLGVRNPAEVLAAVASSQVLRLDAIPGSGSLLIGNDEESAEDELVRRDGETAVRRAVEELPERWRTVVKLCFFDGHTQAEVGEILGVTASRVCQIQAKALGRLRDLLVA
ncbi:MAG: sigma-70 family RNA polymerase sigma factor [Actinomycetota bacterium]|nr:sigma-70 family RNA polymerase sigma factor [Actinomycetota bacterium]